MRYRGNVRRDVAVKTLKGEITYYKNLLDMSLIIIGTFDQADVDKFVEESLKMSRFKHMHVMSLIGVCLDAGTAPYIVMPYMANGSLLQYLKKEREHLVFTLDVDEDVVLLHNTIYTGTDPIIIHCRLRMPVNV